VLGLGINDTLFSSERKPNGKQGRVADHVLQPLETSWRPGGERISWHQGGDASDGVCLETSWVLHSPPEEGRS
jgi:hypothetical protein